ncbi:methionyl-tRNA formyltransferase [Paenibacillus anaericanus]|uniref:Methionyl-tRNA formyltransferase n=1 Tax=Paenibacillus anaericanus TaxID=170367 RepID=A0A3S1ED33_9BACL|nr:formyltransferase family protein [Paenibacillus anaericanus]RUT43001.1 methionyl-tRNA formyltransferase [Paenibacillus anaericanus]
MRLLLITGSHPRHSYVAQMLYNAGFLSSLIVENREEFLPSPPDSIVESDKELFIRHFKEREQAEHRAFKVNELSHWSIPILKVEAPELNSSKVKDWVINTTPDVVISYGVHKLGNNILSLFPKYSWNIHGGLSPWYRGNTTLFWPFYFMKPNWSGMTIHRLTEKLDGGSIVHHSVPELDYGDGIHDVACKAVKQVSLDLVAILQKISLGEEIVETLQKSSGKLFTSADWEPHHLRVIYELFNNDIVDHYLDGKLGHSQPPLIRAF